MNNNNLIISVGRQLGSGGRIIAKMLAEEFGCKFYDREERRAQGISRPDIPHARAFHKRLLIL